MIIYGNSDHNEKRIVYPIPFTIKSDRTFINKITKSKRNLENMKETFGRNNNVNKYLGQNKFLSFSDYLPNNNVLLNWEEYKSSNVNDYYTLNKKKFFELLRNIINENPHIKNVFIVCEAPFIVSLINSVSNNKMVSSDLIEHTSMWSFKCELSKGGFFKNEYKIKRRNKVYPLGRNHGLLQTIEDNLYFYVYKDIKVPLFYTHKPIPLSFISPKYLTLCKIMTTSILKNKEIKNIEPKQSSIKMMLEEIKKGNKPIK